MESGLLGYARIPLFFMTDYNNARTELA